MTKFMLNALAFFVLSLVLASVAQAIPRTYVTMAGNDSNTCAFLAPCRTFNGAFIKTDSNGEIIPLESGNYGRLTINRPVSIIAPPGALVSSRP